MSDKGDRRKSNGCWPRSGKSFRSIHTAHHQDHGSRYAFSILDYPLLMHRSKSICLIYIASHIRFYNWYLNMWKTMLSALNKMVVLDLGVIIYQSLMLTATHFLFQLLWFCILCIKEDRPPIENPVRTGPCNRFSDLEPFGTLPVCWTVGPGGHSILDLVGDPEATLMVVDTWGLGPISPLI